jgi:hypothetical protein
MIFEIFVPYFEICGIKITPLVDKIEPGKVVEVIV